MRPLASNSGKAYEAEAGPRGLSGRLIRKTDGFAVCKRSRLR